MPMSALGRKRTFMRGPDGIRFGSKAVIGLKSGICPPWVESCHSIQLGKDFPFLFPCYTLRVRQLFSDCSGLQDTAIDRHNLQGLAVVPKLRSL